MNSIYKLEIAALIAFGLSGSVLFFSYFFFPLSVVLFYLGAGFGFLAVLKSIGRVLEWSVAERMMLGSFSIFGLSHAIGLFLPETGFDAVWYHLPLTQLFVQLHKIVFLPGLYLSGMAELGSYVFVPPFAVLHEFGVKLFCYLIVLLLPILVFQIGKLYLPRKIALLVALVFFSLHTVAWQASSAYVDQLCAAFELCMILVLLRSPKHVAATGILLGFALATKILTLFFLPAFAVFSAMKLGAKKTIFLFAIATIVASPWYLQALIWTGNPLYPMFQVVHGITKLNEAGIHSWPEWIALSTVRFVLLPIYLTLHRESFTTPLFAFSFPFLWLSRKKLLASKFRAITLLTLLSFATWLMMPPLSVRYGLAFFALALVICTYGIWDQVKNHARLRKIFYTVCILSLILSFGVRLGANLAAVHYLTGKETRDQYIARYAVGIEKGPMDLWYSGYWANWTGK